MRPSHTGLVFVLAWAALSLVLAPAVASESRAARADKLVASARRRVATGTHEQRRMAITELEEAAKLDPERSEIALTLGRLYLEADRLHDARGIATTLEAHDSTLAGAWRLDGEVWRRSWLTSTESSDRDRAIRRIGRSTRLAPNDPAGWKLLIPMLVDAHEFEAAGAAASHAARAAPNDPQAQVLLAAVFQRHGDLESAARVFERAIPRLTESERRPYEDITPLLPSWAAEHLAGMDATQRERFTRDFWSITDPNPVSVQNEARLEFWARVTQALALYGPPSPGEWDCRAQYYVRFGAPDDERFNPIDDAGGQVDVVAWRYQDLGLQLRMSTAIIYSGLSVALAAPVLRAYADRDSLSRHPELYAVYGGHAVFHRLAGGATPLEARLALARFQSEGGARLFAQVEAAGGIEDRRTVTWVVTDSTSARVAGDRLSMSASACEAGQVRAGSFVATLQAGRYRVAVEVSDDSGPRAVLSRYVVLTPVAGQLALSDLVVTCGSPAQSVIGGSSIRLEPATGLVPLSGDRLNAYVEIYGLEPTGGGTSRFSYECVVRPVLHDTRGWLSRMLAPLQAPSPIRVTRTETSAGALRRQFLSVPVGALPAGQYQMEVTVQAADHGTQARSVAVFERGR